MSRHSIVLAGVEHVFACSDEQNVLSALSAVHHRAIRSGCHGGGCGVCKVKVREGQWRRGCMSRAHVSAEEEAEGIVLACRIWPESDLVIEAWGKLPARLARRAGLLPCEADT